MTQFNDTDGKECKALETLSSYFDLSAAPALLAEEGFAKLVIAFWERDLSDSDIKGGVHHVIDLIEGQLLRGGFRGRYAPSLALPLHPSARGHFDGVPYVPYDWACRKYPVKDDETAERLRRLLIEKTECTVMVLEQNDSRFLQITSKNAPAGQKLVPF